MAKNSMTTLTITINAKQAEDVLDSMKNKLKATSEELEKVREKLNDNKLWGEGDTYQGLKDLEKQLSKDEKSLKSAVNQAATAIKGVDEVLANISKASYNELTKTRTTLTNTLKNRKRETEDELKTYEETAERLQKVRDEIAKRDVDMKGSSVTQKAESVLATPSDYSTAEIKDAIKTMELLRNQTQVNTTEWHQFNNAIKQGQEFLDKWNDRLAMTAANKRQVNLPTISDQALAEQKKYWQEMVAGAEQGSAALASYKKFLSEVTAEEQRRASSEAGKVMGNLQGSSVAEIQEAIKVTERLRDAHARGSQEYEIYNEEIKRATEYLKSYTELEKQVEMEDKWQNLATLSTQALSEQKKYWQEMVAGAGQGTTELAEYEAKLKAVVAEEQRRNYEWAHDVVNMPNAYSVREIEDAIKLTKDLQAAQQPGSKEWRNYGKDIEYAQGVLDNYNNTAKRLAMSDKLHLLDMASTSSLSEQKKYWQEMMNGATNLSQEYYEYERNLKKVTDEEQRRTKIEAEAILQTTAGWRGTIDKTKEAIKVLEQYKGSLSVGNTPEITRVDQAIATLNKKLGNTANGFKTIKQALDAVDDLENFDGTIEDLEKLKKRLEEIRKTEINLGDADAEKQIKEIDGALEKLNARIKGTSQEAFNLEKVLKNPKGASFNELQKAANLLEEELKNCVQGTNEFIEKSASLREVNNQLTSIKKEWKEQEDIITKTAKRLASYILVYAGWNEVWGEMKEVFHANIELSDSLADIQKTTGLSADSVGRLSDEINAIDTRTAQQELHELAYEAGRLGISAEGDVLAFVRAGNQLLVALGEDLGGAEAVRSLMKVNAVLGETGKLGVEKALLSTGSAINEISQTSRASAGPIADMVARMGAIGASANMGMADLVALAGTADALGQSAEISGTAFNKFISTLQTNTVDVAYALGMDPKRLQQLMDSGKTMQAIIEIFERMNLKGSMSQLAPVMKDLGSEGARMTQVLTTMAKGVEELKSQVFTSNLAFQEATSVTNEYNIKNESAAAILERMANNLREKVVRSGVVEFLQDVLRNLYYLPNVLERNRTLLLAVRAIMWEIAAVSGVKLVSMIGKSLVLAWGNLTKAMRLYNAVAARSVLGSQYATLIRTASGVQKLSIAFRTLAMAIKANPILIIGTVIASVATAIHHFAEETNKAAKAAAEYDAAVRKEQFELENLAIRIERANTANGERSALIKELNGKYGQYLGFLVTEENYLRNQEYIYKLLNAQIARSLALKMQEKLVTDISSKYSDKQLEAYEDMNRALTNFKGIGEGGARSAMAGLMESIKEQAKAGSEDIDSVIISTLVKASGEFEKKYLALQKSMQTGDKNQEWFNRSLRVIMNDVFGGANIQSLKNAVEEMLEVEVAIAQEVSKAADISDANIKFLDNQVNEIKKAEAESLLGKIDATTDPEVLKEYQSKLGDYIRVRQTEAKELSIRQAEQNSLTAEEAKLLQSVTSEVQKYKSTLDEVEGKLAAMGKLSIWGDGKTIKDMDVNQLVAMYKQLESDGRKIGTNAAESIQTAYWKGFENQKDAIKWYYEEAKKIKDELELRGYNTSGKFKWSGDGSAKKKAQEEYKAAMAALDAYYKEREAVIREEGVKENRLQSTIDAQLAANQAAWKKDKVELIKMLVGDISEFDPFDNEGYMGEITQNIFFGKNRDKGYLTELAAQLSKFGIVMEDGMRNTLSSALVDLGKIAETEVERMRKILLQDDFTEQVAQQYMDGLGRLGLLFSLTGSEIETQNAELGRVRLETMRMYADQSYNMTAAELEKKMKQNAAFSEWVIGREKESYEVLLGELRKFHDDQEEADRKAAERRKKILENSAEGRALTQKNAANISAEEEDVEMWDRFKGMNLVTDDTADRAQIDVYQAKIAASQAWIEQIEAQMAVERKMMDMKIGMLETDIALRQSQNEDATKAEAELAQLQAQRNAMINQQDMMTLQHKQEIADASQQILDRQTAIEQRKVSEMKKYTDAIVDFSGQMGEAAWGEVEDRQEAGKQLIKSLLTTLKDWAAAKLTELAMQQLFANQSNAIAGGEMITNLTAEGAEAAGSVAINSVKATAKETGKLGLKGLLVGAAISAALSALLGVALGALNKKKSEVASVTGASTGGKLATGMLTYAEGNYPVLGNDGNVYNAKYEGRGMKTGVYGGGAHFGIFSEKQPEAIIDGKTTKKLMLNYPEIWKSIVTLSRVGRIERGMGMRTFATGNIQEIAATAATADAAATAAQNEATLAMMNDVRALMTANMALMNKLATDGVKSSIAMYGDGGMYKSMEKAGKFAKRRGY